MKRDVFLYILFSAFIFFFVGCANYSSLLIKEAELREIEKNTQEQAEWIRVMAREQVIMNQAMADYSQAMFLQLRDISCRQEQLEGRLDEIEKVVHAMRLREREAVKSERREAVGKSTGKSAGKSTGARLRDKQVVGAVEKVFITPPGKILPARIDTGAVTSSLNAHNIQKFERNGDEWIRFTIVNPENSEEYTLERPLVRSAKIIQALSKEVDRRPVVELSVTVGGINQIAQFTLSDRSHMEHPVLIGRNVLKDVMVVDVSETYIAPPGLPPEPPGDITRP